LDTPPFAPHRFTPSIECLSQNRSLRLNKVLSLIDHFFKRLTGTTGEITKIVLRTTGIPPKLVTRFIPRLWRQQQCCDRAHRRPTQKRQ
jgi:hypothetical protein